MAENLTKRAYFYFHDRLKDLLNSKFPQGWIQVSFKGRQSAKHLVESLRVPHTEIGAIVVNRIERALGYIVSDGDRVEIFPQDPSHLLIENIDPKFILDNHLGKLAVYLRMCGFDTLYQNDFQDELLTKLTVEQDRILITRDRGLLMRKVIQKGYWIRSLNPREQFKEVLTQFKLQKAIVPFHRCLKCNSELTQVEKAEIIDRLLPLTKKYYHQFYLCKNCNQIYWRGSHFERMNKFIQEVVSEIV